MNIRLFSTDLDGTLLGHPAAAQRFARAWPALEPARRPLLVYNTGRSVAATRALVHARDLPEPEFILGGVGTELHDALYNRAAEFRHGLEAGWDLARVEAIVGTQPGVKRQPTDNSPFKSSWFWERARHEDLVRLQQALADAGLSVNVIYSCRHFLDVVPQRAGKGRALAWLCARLSIPLTHVLVAGDTANDRAMFELPGVRGIVVDNALPELSAAVRHLTSYRARAAMADGVLEGLAHFEVLVPIAAESNAALPV